MQPQVWDTIRTFVRESWQGPKEVVAPIAVLISAFWYALSSVLVWALGALFIADLALGTLRAVHKGGLKAFDWGRFWRSFIKMGAAIFGIILFSAGDVIFQQLGIPDDWFPLTTAGLVGLCFGFFWSGLENFGYFYPSVRDKIEKLISRLNAKSPEDMRRRFSDEPTESEE